MLISPECRGPNMYRPFTIDEHVQHLSLALSFTSSPSVPREVRAVGGVCSSIGIREWGRSIW